MRSDFDDGSRRGNEADGPEVLTIPPPHVGGYEEPHSGGCLAVWRRGSESNRSIGFFHNLLLRYYHLTTRGEQPHN